MHLYLAGPMTGYRDYNFPTFNAVTRYLRSRGHTVTNPAENFGGRVDLPWATYLRQALRQVLDARHVALLPGWQGGLGASIEVLVSVVVRNRLHDASRPDDLPDLHVGFLEAMTLCWRNYCKRTGTPGRGVCPCQRRD